MANQRARAATESLGFLAISAGILVLANVLVQFTSVRLDCTANDLFSLSQGSTRLAGSLTDDMEITGFFTEDLPPPFQDTRRYVADILAEYEAASKGKIQVEFVNPDTDAERERAEQAGIPQVEHAAIQDDSTNVVKGYRGIVLHYLDQTEVIPVVRDTAGLEYAITMKIKKMVGDRRPIGVLGGHDGPSLTKGLSKLRDCLPTYDLREVQASEDIDPELAALLVVEPQTTIPEDDLRRINAYVMQGGSLGVFGGTMKIALDGMEPQATPVDTGINTLLRPWGVVIKNGIVHDAQCGRAPLRTQIGMIPVPHPPVPIVSIDEAQAEHPVLFRLDSLPLPFTSPLELTAGSDALADVTVTTLMSSSQNSWNVSTPTVSLRPRDPRSWPQTSDTGPFPLTVAIKGKLPSAFAGSDSEIHAPDKAEHDVHVLVTGGSFFMRDEALPQQQQQGDECQLSSHLAFALNTIDWLAQESDLIAIRAKNVEEPAIEVPQDVSQAEDEARQAATKAIDAVQEGNRDDAQQAVDERDQALERRKAALENWQSTKGLYRWGNMLGIPLLFGLFGVLRWQMRMNKRRNLKL